jgi:rhodanese-related sulfurtransferase
MVHTPGFLNLVNDAKKRVNEISVAEARALLAANPKVVLLDVREDNEWLAGHAAEAVRISARVFWNAIWRSCFPTRRRKSSCIAAAGSGRRSHAMRRKKWAIATSTRSSAVTKGWWPPAGR